jgi:hypothetical protein
VLYLFSSRFIVYDALTGAVTLNVTGMSAADGVNQAGSIGWVDPYVYSTQTSGSTRFFLKWTTVGNSADFASRIIWNITWPIPSQPPHNDSYQGKRVFDVNGDVMMQVNWPWQGNYGAINTTNGELLWTYGPVWEPFITSRDAIAGVNGLLISPVHTRKLAAWNMTTGEIVWYSNQTDYPWGDFFAYTSSQAYGMIFKLTYAGIYAFNATNGKIEWHYTAGSSGTETPYGTWPFYGEGPLIADGKAYAGTGEHSPTTPYLRGQQLHCIDAYTGKPIWSIMGYMPPTAIAEGTLFATNTYDGDVYAFAKGETSTSVSVSSKVVQKGSSVLIEGTVLDQSPAQLDTAAISDDSMSAWMEYLHMQQPKPTNATGVQVKLVAIDANGAAQDLGTVTSDTTGLFKKLWTPKTEGEFTIVASFEGSNSYYASFAETAVGVSLAAAAPSGYVQPETSATPQATTQPTGVTTPTTPLLSASPEVTSVPPQKRTLDQTPTNNCSRSRDRSGDCSSGIA